MTVESQLGGGGARLGEAGSLDTDLVEGSDYTGNSQAATDTCLKEKHGSTQTSTNAGWFCKFAPARILGKGQANNCINTSEDRNCGLDSRSCSGVPA